MALGACDPLSFTPTQPHSQGVIIYAIGGGTRGISSEKSPVWVSQTMMLFHVATRRRAGGLAIPCRSREKRSPSLASGELS